MLQDFQTDCEEIVMSFPTGGKVEPKPPGGVSSRVPVGLRQVLSPAVAPGTQPGPKSAVLRRQAVARVGNLRLGLNERIDCPLRVIPNFIATQVPKKLFSPGY